MWTDIYSTVAFVITEELTTSVIKKLIQASTYWHFFVSDHKKKFQNIVALSWLQQEYHRKYLSLHAE